MTSDRRGFFVAVLLAACGSAPPAEPIAPTKATPVATAADLLPNDLDFVVRVDSGRVRSSPIFAGALRDLARTSSSDMLRSVLPAIEQSRSLFVGGRVMSDGFRGDGVVAIELDSASDGVRQVASADPSFRRIPGEGTGVELFERTAILRADAVLKVVLERGMVLATAAEADAVLRVVRAGPDADRLDPPAHGLASFAGRWRSTRIADSSTEASVLRQVALGLASFSGTVEALEGFQVEADLVYGTPAAAEKAALAARQVLDRIKALGAPYKALSDSATLAQSAQALTVRATVPFALVASVH